MYKLYVILVFVFFSSHLQAQQFVPGEVLIKLKNSAHTPQSQNFLSKVSHKGMNMKAAWAGMKLYHFSFKDKSVEQAVQELKADPEVEYAEPNYILSKAQTESSVESFSLEEMYQQNNGQALTTTDAPINLKFSDASTYSGSSTVVVAVIDTGLDTNHRVFTESDAIWKNTNEIPGNGIDDDNNGYVDDVNGWNYVTGSSYVYDDDNHGTHVSGIVLSTAVDIFKTPMDISPVKIMPLKFLDADGKGSTASAIKAIYYAVQNGADVLNNSWGGSAYSVSLHEAVSFAYNQGLAFVAAAGNSSKNNDSAPMYPASLDVPNVVSVAATTSQDSLASFSNYGYNTVALGSPGLYIRSTVAGGNFGYMSGTSMAAPYVAGLAALMKLNQPNMMSYQIRDIIQSQSDFSAYLAGKVHTEGRVNMNNTVQAAKFASVMTSQPPYSISEGMRSLDSSEAQQGGCGLASKVYSDFQNQKGKGMRAINTFVLMGLLLLPAVVLLVRRMKSPACQRRYERYEIDSSVRLKVGGQELVGQVSSISLGGVQVNTEALLENGGVVSMKISSPDGTDVIEVQGKVVWSAEKKAYGVQFADTSSQTLNSITQWTRGLSKTG